MSKFMSSRAFTMLILVALASGELFWLSQIVVPYGQESLEHWIAMILGVLAFHPLLGIFTGVMRIETVTDEFGTFGTLRVDNTAPELYRAFVMSLGFMLPMIIYGIMQAGRMPTMVLLIIFAFLSFVWTLYYWMNPQQKEAVTC